MQILQIAVPRGGLRGSLPGVMQPCLDMGKLLLALDGQAGQGCALPCELILEPGKRPCRVDRFIARSTGQFDEVLELCDEGLRRPDPIEREPYLLTTFHVLRTP